MYFSSFGVVFKILIRDLVGPVGIAQNIAYESDSLFLAAFELIVGESLHFLRLAFRSSAEKTKHMSQSLSAEVFKPDFLRLRVLRRERTAHLKRDC